MIMEAFFGTTQNVPVWDQDEICEVKDIMNKLKFACSFYSLASLELRREC